MEFIATLFDSINLLLSFILHGFQSVLEVITHIPMFVSWVVSLVGLLPAEIKGFAILGVSLSVMLMFVGFIKTDTTGGK